MIPKLLSHLALLTTFLLLNGLTASSKITYGVATGVRAQVPVKANLVADDLNLNDYGAVGDGVTDDGPAFQRALDALAETGGGTLFVPPGRYAITTAVSKNFAGTASSITIMGVESSTQVAPPTSPGSELAKGLDLVSEIYPRTGAGQNAISITGVQRFLVKDIAFVGTPTVVTDAAVTLLLSDIEKASVRHCEFYGLATLVQGGGVIKAVRSNLEISECKFLGSTAASGRYVPVVENVEWRGITVSDTHFVDYGLRDGFFSKTNLGASISWINIGNSAKPEPDSPRREAIIRNVFLDEGSYWGLSSLPFRYQPAGYPIDLIYVSGLNMNVSNFLQTGHQLYDAQRVFIRKSRYAWSHNAYAAVSFRNIENVILDQLTCIDHADDIFADSDVGRLTVINSTYSDLNSSAASNNVIQTTEELDPVQYVNDQFEDALEREPDPAAHFYWSDLLIRCGTDVSCQHNLKERLDLYLSHFPQATFSINGRVRDVEGAGMPGVTVALTGSQTVSMQTNSNGEFAFKGLPTSGQYVVTPAINHYTFSAVNETFTTPAADQSANFTGVLNTHVIAGKITAKGNPLSGVTVTVSGGQSATAITNDAGDYSFTLNAGGAYTLTPTKPHYTFNPPTNSIVDLSADKTVDFSATLNKHRISGRVLTARGEAITGAAVLLSGSQTSTTTTSSDGSYEFANVDGGSNCIVTASKANYILFPQSRIFNDLESDKTADFTATLRPTLLTLANSSRALALESITFVEEPFSPMRALFPSADNRTRVIFFGTNLGLLPGEGSEAVMVEAEDAMHIRYPLTVEFIGGVPELPLITAIVVRLNDNLGDVGDVLVSLTVHGLKSNRVRVGIGHVGGGPPDDR